MRDVDHIIDLLVLEGIEIGLRVGGRELVDAGGISHRGAELEETHVGIPHLDHENRGD